MLAAYLRSGQDVGVDGRDRGGRQVGQGMIALGRQGLYSPTVCATIRRPRYP